MPVLPFELMESIYESSYFVDMSEDKNGDTQQTPLDIPQITNTTTEPEPPKEQYENRQHCAIHGCDVSDENTSISKSVENDPINTEIVSFPVAAKVCETSNNSSLHEFNPLNDSEPNLEFDMSN